jgi:hypothetical protein
MRTNEAVPQSEGWFVLPELVEERELAPLTRAVRSVSRPVLDFSNTVHIRWRDAAEFARRLLSQRPRALVRVTGLDEYCAQILRFAWPSEAWELFELITEEGVDAARMNAQPPSTEQAVHAPWMDAAPSLTEQPLTEELYTEETAPASAEAARPGRSEAVRSVTGEAARGLGEDRARNAESAIRMSRAPELFWMPCMN